MTTILDLDLDRRYVVCDLRHEEINPGQPLEHEEGTLSEHDYHRRCVHRSSFELIRGGRA